MPPAPRRARPHATVVVFLLSCLLGACGGPEAVRTAPPPSAATGGSAPAPSASSSALPLSAAPSSSAPSAARAPAAAPPSSPAAGRLVAVNGAVPILEYHRLGPANARWTRSYTSFAADLQELYARGFRPVDLRSLHDAVLPIPPGTHPLVLTFDDGDPSQFTWSKADPGLPGSQSVAGMLWRFHLSHPGWAFAATFFVNKTPFGGDSQAKLAWLVAHGAEIGNHTYDHANLAAMSLAGQLAEIGREQAYLAQMLPGYRVVDFAYPYGAVPHWRQIASGTYAGVSWHFRYLALVGSNPLASVPATTPVNVPRIQVAPPSTVVHPQWRDLVWSSWVQRWLPTAHLYSVRRT